MILIDTAPLVALCDRRDSRHGAAVATLGALSPAGLRTCEAVVTEACFHLPHPSQRRRLHAVLTQFDVAPVLTTVGLDFWVDVLEWLAKYAEHEPDWADGCVAVLSGYDKRLRVWTYDREFHTTWRRPDGSAIPLVG